VHADHVRNESYSFCAETSLKKWRLLLQEIHHKVAALMSKK